MFNTPQHQDFPDGSQGSSNSTLWWNMFMAADKESASGVATNSDTGQKLAPTEPTESASSARSSLLFPESMRASSSSSSEEEPDDADSENASTTTDTSSTAQRRRDPQKRLGGTITALSGATLLLEAETDGEDGEQVAADTSEASLDKHGGRHAAASASASVWNITAEQRRYYLREFTKLQPNLAGLIPGLLAKQYFVRSELPNQVLAEIWAMSDLDADGALNITEFCCAMHLVVAVRNCVNLPSVLPAELLHSALQIAERIRADPAYSAAIRLGGKKNSGEKKSDATLRPVPAVPTTSESEGVLIPLSGAAGATEPWPSATTESITDATQQNLAFPSNVPSRASSMASNLASFDDRPPASALYPFAVRPVPVLPAQIPPPPPPRRQPQQQQQHSMASSPPMPTNPVASLAVTSLLTSQAVSASASSLQPLLPVNDSASITSATSDSSQLQLLVPPLEQLRARNQQLALRYRELMTELERIRLERTTLQTRLKQFRMTGSNSSHRHDMPAIPTSVLGGEMKNN